jgi:malate/lactate dehydrogenase
MGGHGDDMVPLADFSTVAGVNLSEVLSQDDIDDIINSLHCAIEGWPWCDLIHCFN